MKNESIIIRKAKDKDVPQVIDLVKGITDFHHKLDPYYLSSSKMSDDAFNRIKNLVRKRKAVLVVAEIDKKIVGYFIADVRRTRMRMHDKIGYVSDGFIHEKYRNRGIGRMLFNWLKEWFVSKDVRHIELSVDSRNPIGIKGWESYGFKEYMKRMRVDI